MRSKNTRSGRPGWARSAATALIGAAALVTGVLTAAAPSTAASPPPTTDSQARDLCAQSSTPGDMSCFAKARTDVSPHRGLTSAAAVSGYGPSQLQSAYALASAAASSGSGQTVAIVDAYDDPSAASDLATYRSQFGLPACTVANGCFTKVSQTGSTTSLPSPAPASDDWAGEESLDVDMVSAVCPLCHILLVEANSPTDANLGTAVNRAVTMGAKYVSNSYGGDEASSETSEDSQYYNHPGVAVTVSSGDEGYGAEYPASSRYVTSVGGTTLNTASNARGWTERVWGSSTGRDGAGSGCSAYESKPSWQHDSACSRRTVADVSAVADPSTGVAVYDTFNGMGGWNVFGGTSASSPIIAAVYALAGTPEAGSTPASYPYAKASAFNDVTSGTNGSCGGSELCTAGTGYDGPTGLGTPNGTAAFTSGGSTGGNGVSVTNPGNRSTAVGTATSLQISGSDSAGLALTYSATGLPAGLSISSGGLISGTPNASGTYSVTVTAKDSTGATGSASFTWTVTSTGGGCTTSQLLGNAGFETGSAAPWSASSGVVDNNSDEPARSGSWKAWLDGYGSTHTDTLAQTVTIPAGCSATLSFWQHIDTEESGSTAYDTLKVQLGSTTLATYSNANRTTGYVQRSFDVSSFAGRTVTLTFTGTEDSSLATNFVVDDTALSVS